jgi:hypothetical protein
MLGNILRLAMLAGTGAGMATRIRRAMLKLAAVFAAALVVALMVAVAFGYFGAAIYLVLAPEIGAAWAAAAAGLLLIVAAAILAVIARSLYSRRQRQTESAAGTAGLGLGGPLGATALGVSLGSGAGPDIRGMLERNALTVLLTAFIAGMVMNNRK